MLKIALIFLNASSKMDTWFKSVALHASTAEEGSAKEFLDVIPIGIGFHVPLTFLKTTSTITYKVS